MEEKVILLVDADADTAGLVLEASAQTGHGVRLSRNAREAFEFLRREFDHIAGIVIDVDPGTHGLAVLEAMSALRERRPPMLVLTGLEESYMEPIARRHGASACLGKPVSPARLQGAIGQLSSRCRGESCDPWGHPSGRCSRVLEGKQSCRR
ncbi:MAG TPA: response regulator [Chthoniobacterales bacterium]